VALNICEFKCDLLIINRLLIINAFLLKDIWKLNINKIIFKSYKMKMKFFNQLMKNSLLSYSSKTTIIIQKLKFYLVLINPCYNFVIIHIISWYFLKTQLCLFWAQRLERTKENSEIISRKYIYANLDSYKFL